MKRRTQRCRSISTARPLLVALVVVLAALALFPTMALASSATWTGSGATPFWSLGLNWLGGTAPANGDNLVFPAGAFVQATNDSSLTDVGSVDVAGSIMLGSDAPLVVRGPLSAHDSPTWNIDTYLANDLTVSETPAATPAPMTIGGSFDMDRAEYTPSKLTFNVGALGSIRHSGSIVGPNAACTVTKTGAGDLRLGWGGADGAAWTGTNTWKGATSVQGGSLTLWNPGALPSGSSLDIAAGSTVTAHYGVAGHTTDTWNNAITGHGSLNVDAGSLTLGASSPDFAGTTTVNSGAALTVGDTNWVVLYGNVRLAGGTLAGVGGTDSLVVDDGGVLSPGAHDYDVTELWANTSATFMQGGSYTVDVSDVDQGPVYGYDFLQTGDSGTAAVTATPAHPFTIKLRSANNGASGDAANFSKDTEYHWPVIWAGGGITGFDPHAFTVDTSEFTNDFGKGHFSVEEVVGAPGEGTSINVVFSPVQAPTITACSLPNTLGAASWTNVTPAAWTVQAVDPQNDDMTLNYEIDGDGTVHTAPLSGTPRQASGQSALEGTHTVDIWVTDIHGYPSDHVTGYFKLDSVAPTTSESTSYLASAATTWTNVNLATPNGPATLAATDATSGVASTQYRVKTGSSWGSTLSFSPITITDQNTHDIEFWATDNAGNTSVHKTKYYNLDKTNPVLTFGAHNPYYGTTGVTFTWSATDNVASTSDLRYQYKLVAPGQTESAVPYNADNTDLTKTYGAVGSPLAVGVYSFYCRVRDTAGNWDTRSFTFEVKTFTVTSSSGSNGIVTPTGVQTVDYGANKTFTMTPDAHYHVADVLVDGSSVGAVTSYSFTNVTANHTVAATFAIDTYTITASSGANGSVSPAGAQAVPWNGSQTFTVTPNAHYHVADVLVDGTSVGAVTSYTFSNVSAIHTISATFAIDTFTLTPSSGSNGTVTPTGVQTVDYGTSKTFTVTPSAHYHVADVLVDGTSVGAVTSYAFSNVSANHTISATFAIDTYAITPSAGSNGSISPATVQTVNWNGSKAFTITPDAHYHVADVLVNGTSVGAVTSYTFSNVAANYTISATFAIDTYTITPSAGSNGSISPATVQTVNWNGSKAFTITPDAHYHVADVLVDGTSVGAATSYAFSNVAANHTISASFAIDTYTITPSAGSNGSISPASAQTVNWNGSKAFTITPDAHYHVADVLVDGASVGAVTSYTFSNVAANHTISASFAIDTYAITPSAGANGSISPATVQTVNWNGSKAFTITPSAHYHVADVLVDGASVGAVTSYTFSNVAASHTISASFAIDTYAITPSAGANGSISPATVQTVNWNGSKAFTITPSAHYHVADVLVDGASVGAVTSYTFSNVAASHTISASFAIDTNTITASAGTNGSISPSGATSVNYGADQSFTITPNAHYHVADVLVDGSSVGAVTSRTFTNVTSGHTISATFAIDTNTITASAGAHGSISPSGAVNVNYGADQSFTITPDAHYHVADVLVDGSSVGAVTSRTFTNVTSGHIISATFAIDTNTIAASAGTNGSISPSGATSVNYGADQSFTITPDAHYHVADVLVDGSSVGAVTSRTFTNVTSGHTISATFAIDTYTITPTAGSNGSISPATVQTVNWNASKAFTITPDAHYHVADVLVDGTSVGAVTSYTFSNVSANHTISATFAIDTYTITPTAGSNGSISPAMVQTVNWNGSQAFTITPDAGYQVQDVLVDGASVGAVTSYAFTGVAANHTIAVQFQATVALTAPNSGSFAQGTNQTVTWTMASAVGTGSFRIWLQDSTTGDWVWGTPAASAIPAVAGQTSYSTTWGVSQPVGNYKLWVYYYSSSGRPLATAVSSGTITVALAPTPTLTTPNSGSFDRNTTQTVAWTMNTPVSTGYFRIWLQDSTTGDWVWGTPAGSAISAVPGQTSYSSTWTVAQPAGNYKLWVYYYSASGAQLATAVSSGTLNIKVALTLNTPNSGSFDKGTTQTVTWSLNGSVSSGTFRIWLQDSTTGDWVWGTPAVNAIPAVAGQTSYSTNWTASQPAGSYRLWVYYYGADGRQAATVVSSGTVSVKLALTLTTPNSGTFDKGTDQTVAWSLNGSVSTGYFRIWLQDSTTGNWVWGTPSGSPISAVAGQSSYSTTWNVAQPASSYNVWVYYYSADGRQVANVCSSGTLTVKLALTLTTPNSGTFDKGTDQTVAWSLNGSVSTGYFRIWLQDSTTGNWVWGTPSGSAINAVAGQSSYSTTWNVAQPAGNYKLWVYYYSADGRQVANVSSSGTITIPVPPSVSLTTPNSGSFAKGSTPSVAWTINTPVSTGYFRLWLQDSTTGNWVWGTPSGSLINAVAAQTSYNTTWTVAQATGSYYLWVYYYSATGRQLATTVSSGTIAVTP